MSLGLVVENDGKLKVEWDSGKTSDFDDGHEAETRLVQVKRKVP